MAAEIDNAAVLDKDYFIHILDGGYSVRDKYGGFALAGVFEIFEYYLFGFYVYRGDRIVENEYLGVFHKRAGDRNSLLLSARNGNAALAEHGLIPLGEILYIIVNVRKHSRFFDSLCVVAFGGEGDIFGYRIAEKEIILRNVCRVLAQGFYRNRVYVVPVDKYGAVGYVIGAENKVRNRRFAASGSADDANAFA